MDGHEGHRGNVLAHAWISKVGALLSVLARMERQYLAVARRKTVFEVTNTQKRNPTIVSLKPVASAPAYDPIPALQWSLEQLERVATGQAVDGRIDAETADMMATLAKPPTEDAYRRFWINGFADPVVFDEKFGLNARTVAAQRRATSVEPDWFVGVSRGTVTGKLQAIDDEQGNRSFVLIPPVGPERVVCKFPEHMRDEMGKHVFKSVRVNGLLTYAAASPFPVKVDMTQIEGLGPANTHLIDLEGLFVGLSRPEPDLASLIDV